MKAQSHVQPAALPELDGVRALARASGAPLVSLYLPLRRSLPVARSNPAALTGAVAEAEQRLAEAGIQTAEAQAIGKQLTAVETDLRRLERPAAGIAVFHDRSVLHAFRLPSEPALCVAVGGCFALRPLLAAVHRNRRHRVLALSAKRVALYEGDAFGLTPIAAPGVPASLEDALGSELSEKELRVATTQGGRDAPKYFSHDSGRDERKLDLARFHRTLARALEAALRDHDEPVVLVATRAHHAGLRDAARLPQLLAAGVEANPDHLSPSELHALAWPVVENATLEADATLAREYERAVNRGKGLHRIADVAVAAAAGRVRRLWVASDEQLSGSVDPASGALVGGRPGEDVIDGIVTLVLRHGGDVIVGERVPASSAVAAELR